MRQFFPWLRLAAEFRAFRRQTVTDLATLDAKIQEVQQHVEAVATRVQAQVTATQKVVADLQAKVAALPNAPDFAAETDALTAVEAELDAIGTAPVP